MTSSVKRKKKPVNTPYSEGPRISLERVVGNTVVRSVCLAASQATGELAFVAGCVVVLYNPRTGHQTRFLSSNPTLLSSNPENLVSSTTAAPPSALRALSCVAFSPNGRLVAAGEAGKTPNVHVWDSTTGQMICSLKGIHLRGISCVSFSPNAGSSASSTSNAKSLLLTVGGQNDFICLWDLKTFSLIGQGKAGSIIHACSFSEDGSFFVTAGHRHLKFWALDATLLTSPGISIDLIISSTANSATPQQKANQMEGKSVALGGHRESTFIDIACGRGASRNCVFAVTFTGTLYEFNSNRQMEKWVDLRSHVFALTSSEKFIGCACADGNVRLFHPTSLNYIMTLPKPHPLGRNIVAEQQMRVQPSNTYPDTISCRLLADDSKIACCYSDRSLYIWSIEANAKAVKYRSFLSHSACIWDLAIVQSSSSSSSSSCQQDKQEKMEEKDKEYTFLPSGSFVTSSADGTVRFWNIDGKGPKNSYSKDLLHLIYTTNSCSTESSNESGSTNTANALMMMKTPSDYDRKDYAIHNNLSVIKIGHGTTNSNSLSCCSCLAIRGDSKHLALGDCLGNLKVIDTKTTEVLFDKAAHAADILSMDYSKPMNNSSEDDFFLLATAGRDKLIHIFNAGCKKSASTSYTLICTISDHTSPVNCVRFAFGSRRLISCSTDYELALRSIEFQTNSQQQQQQQQQTFVTQRLHTTTLRSGNSQEQGETPTPTIEEQNNEERILFSVAIDPTEKFIVAGIEKKLSLITMSTCKILRNYKTSASSSSSDGGGGGGVTPTTSMLNVEIDPAGLNVATSSTDKLIRMFDLYTGSLVARVGGHSEYVTALRFTPDCRRLLSVSGDGCTFVWALDPETTRAMQERMIENAMTPRNTTLLPSTNNTPVSITPSPAISPSNQPLPVTEQFQVDEEGGKPKQPHEEYVLHASDTQLPSWAKAHGKQKQQDGSSGSSKRASMAVAKGVWAQRVVDPSLVLLPETPSQSGGGSPKRAGENFEEPAFVGVVDNRTKVEDVAEEEEEFVEEAEASKLIGAEEEPGRQFQVTTNTEASEEELPEGIANNLKIPGAAASAVVAQQQSQQSVNVPPGFTSAPISPKIQMQEPEMDTEDALLSALHSLAAPKVDMLRHSLSSDFLSGLQNQFQQQQQQQQNQEVQQPITSGVELQSGAGGGVKFAFVSEPNIIQTTTQINQMMIPTISTVAELLRPSVETNTTTKQPTTTTPSSSIPHETIIQTEPMSQSPPTNTIPQPTQQQKMPTVTNKQSQQQQQQQENSPASSSSSKPSSPEPLLLHSPKQSPQLSPRRHHRGTTTEQTPVVPSSQTQPLPGTSTTKEVCERLKSALTETIILYQSAKEQSQPTIEGEIRNVLSKVKQEIGAIISSETNASLVLLDSAFERYTKQLLEKIDEHIDVRIHSELEKRNNSTTLSPLPPLAIPEPIPQQTETQTQETTTIPEQQLS